MVEPSNAGADWERRVQRTEEKKIEIRKRPQISRRLEGGGRGCRSLRTVHGRKPLAVCIPKPWDGGKTGQASH